MRTLKTIRNEISKNWKTICKTAGLTRNLPILPATPTLLGTGAKTEKGEKNRWVTAIVYMSPAWELWGTPKAARGRTLCPMATGTGAGKTLAIPVGCIDSCLGKFAGRMVMSPVRNARRWKTALFLGQKTLWNELVTAEIAGFEKSVSRKIGNWRPAIRIDGATDTGIGAQIAKQFPGVMLYDYTKILHRAQKFVSGNYPSNYHVTFSFSGENWAECRRILRAGGNVAAAFGGPIPERFRGFNTFDADDTDLRFLDTARGAIAALKFKTARNFKTAAGAAGAFLIDSAAAGAAIGNRGR